MRQRAEREEVQAWMSAAERAYFAAEFGVDVRRNDVKIDVGAFFATSGHREADPLARNCVNHAQEQDGGRVHRVKSYDRQLSFAQPD